MHSSPRLVVIVPLRAEFANGNLPALLVSLTRQRIPLDVILLVNNRATDADFGTEVWQDNQAALRWLEQCTKPFDKNYHLPADFPQAAAKVRASNLRLHSIDLTDGAARNMGLLRQRGLEAAQAMTKGYSPREVVILSADADCLYGPRCLRMLVHVFTQSTVRMAVLPMLYFPFSPDPAILSSHARQHIPILLDQVLRQWTGAPRARLGAPQLAARLDLVTEAGGYASLEEGEDFDLGQRLGRLTQASILNHPSTLVWTADRALADGFESGARRAGLRNVDAGNQPLPLGEIENPLAVFLAARRKDPDLLSGLVKVFGQAKADWLVQASEREYWSGIEAQAIPRTSTKASDLLEALIIITELETLQQKKIPKSVHRYIERILRLAEKRLGCQATHAGSGSLWPDPQTRQVWIKAVSLMLTIPG